MRPRPRGGRDDRAGARRLQTRPPDGRSAARSAPASGLSRCNPAPLLPDSRMVAMSGTLWPEVAMALTSFEIGRRGPYANMGMWLMAEPEGVSTAVMAILAPLPVLRPDPARPRLPARPAPAGSDCCAPGDAPEVGRLPVEICFATKPTQAAKSRLSPLSTLSQIATASAPNKYRSLNPQAPTGRSLHPTTSDRVFSC